MEDIAASSEGILNKEFDEDMGGGGGGACLLCKTPTLRFKAARETCESQICEARLKFGLADSWWRSFLQIADRLMSRQLDNYHHDYLIT